LPPPWNSEDVYDRVSLTGEQLTVVLALFSREAGVRCENCPPWVFLGLQAALRDDTGVSETTLGVQLTLPGQRLEELAAAG
jgi:hypothetical protein